MNHKAMRLTIVIVISVTVAGCGGNSLEDEMRARAMAMAEAKRAKESVEATLEGQPTAAQAAASKQPPQDDAPPQASQATTPVPKQPSPSTLAQPAKPDTPAPAAAINTPLPTISQRQPSTPQSADARRNAVYTAMKKIGKACEAINSESDNFMMVDNIKHPTTRKPLLSWRVKYLKELGHTELYSLFHLNEPWNSPHNKQLLAYIPNEYVSPERYDDKTNIVAIQGNGYAIGRRWRTEDIYPQSIAFVEVNDDYAVPWTKPEDYETDDESIADGVGELRDGTLAILFDGSVVKIPAGFDPGSLALAAKVERNKDLGKLGISAARKQSTSQAASPIAMAATDPSGSQIATSSDAAVNVPPIPGIASANTPTGLPPSGGAPIIQPTSSAEQPHRPVTTSTGIPFAKRGSIGTVPVPGETELREASDKLRELFREQFAQAKNRGSRIAFGRRMLDQAEAIGADPAGLYALLGAVRNVAVQDSEFPLVVDAIGRLKQTFKVDPYRVDVETLRNFGQQAALSGAPGINVDGFGSLAARVIGEAISRDDYQSASSCATYMERMLRLGDSSISQQAASTIKHQLTVARNKYRSVVPAIDKLSEDPNDQNAAEVVGSFFCFVKGNWEEGVRLLRLCGDELLSSTAIQTDESTTDPADMIRQGDAWWLVGSRKTDPLIMESAKGRALYWYKQALPNLGQTLDRLRANSRIQESSHITGSSIAEKLAMISDEHKLASSNSLAQRTRIDDEDDD